MRWVRFVPGLGNGRVGTMGSFRRSRPVELRVGHLAFLMDHRTKRQVRRFRFVGKSYEIRGKLIGADRYCVM